METRDRKMVWVEGRNFQGWACSQCAWMFNPQGPVGGGSFDEMMAQYEQDRDKEFAAHVCAAHPKSTNPPR
jgi:hypothetical protein